MNSVQLAEPSAGAAAVRQGPALRHTQGQTGAAREKRTGQKARSSVSVRRALTAAAGFAASLCR